MKATQLREASHGEATDARVQAAIDEVATLRVKLDEERAARDKADARAKEERDSLRRRADEEAEQAALCLKQARERGDAEEKAKVELIDRLDQVWGVVGFRVGVWVGVGVTVRVGLEMVGLYSSLSPLRTPPYCNCNCNPFSQLVAGGARVEGEAARGCVEGCGSRAEGGRADGEGEEEEVIAMVGPCIPMTSDCLRLPPTASDCLDCLFSLHRTVPLR